jgi:hypothetical protein
MMRKPTIVITLPHATADGLIACGPDDTVVATGIRTTADLDRLAYRYALFFSDTVLSPERRITNPVVEALCHAIRSRDARKVR